MFLTVLGIGPAAILQVMQCKEYRKRDKKMPSTKAWDANRNENKSCIQYLHVIFVWCLGWSTRCRTLSYTTCWETLFVQNWMCVLWMWADDDWEVPCKSVTLNSCSTLPAVHNLAEVKMCSCNHWAQGGQVTPPSNLHRLVPQPPMKNVLDLVFGAFGNWLSTF